ncbi:MAG: transcriptional regulator GutM [Acidimicrobiales bacterium]
MDSGTIAVLVALAGGWAIQILLSTNQMRRFHRRSQELRRLGTHMATGVSGSMYRRKVYAVLVVGADRQVVAAEQLSGFTVAAGLRPVPELVGLDLDVVGKGEPPEGTSAKQWAAFDHSADFIRSHLAKPRVPDRSDRRAAVKAHAAAGTASQ